MITPLAFLRKLIDNLPNADFCRKFIEVQNKKRIFSQEARQNRSAIKKLNYFVENELELYDQIFKSFNTIIRIEKILNKYKSDKSLNDTEKKRFELCIKIIDELKSIFKPGWFSSPHLLKILKAQKNALEKNDLVAYLDSYNTEINLINRLAKNIYELSGANLQLEIHKHEIKPSSSFSKIVLGILLTITTITNSIAIPKMDVQYNVVKNYTEEEIKSMRDYMAIKIEYLKKKVMLEEKIDPLKLKSGNQNYDDLLQTITKNKNLTIVRGQYFPRSDTCIIVLLEIHEPKPIDKDPEYVENLLKTEKIQFLALEGFSASPTPEAFRGESNIFGSDVLNLTKLPSASNVQINFLRRLYKPDSTIPIVGHEDPVSLKKMLAIHYLQQLNSKVTLKMNKIEIDLSYARGDIHQSEYEISQLESYMEQDKKKLQNTERKDMKEFYEQNMNESSQKKEKELKKIKDAEKIKKEKEEELSSLTKTANEKRLVIEAKKLLGLSGDIFDKSFQQKLKDLDDANLVERTFKSAQNTIFYMNKFGAKNALMVYGAGHGRDLLKTFTDLKQSFIMIEGEKPY